MTDNDDEFEDADEVDERESSPSNSNIHNQAPIMIHIDASTARKQPGHTVLHAKVYGDDFAINSATSPGQITDMVTSIITALRRAGLLDPTENRSTPVKVSINTGIMVEGSRNVICAGTCSPSGHSFAKRHPGQTGKVGNSHGIDRKRRAESVCSYCEALSSSCN
ncbi:hypothetical protein ETB97_002267 [Aspergillus alliaceus]|uniref:Uncharacterized protein n=1 Tax=Petromyces alliaceus TaxID=209559 RepID=A0A8H6EAN0_PETAA|nr:hypothetical protein ETB97_002267 [Aspergillus burnettii]